MQFLFLCTTGLVLMYSVLAQRRPPNYSLDEMPDIETSFSCRDKIVGGYYADAETDCQMFHVCVRIPGVGIQDFRFLCPNDTSFDQENQICDDWYNIDCEAALYYSDNFDLYRIGVGGNGADFGPSKATPIPLGPSSIAPRPQYTKPRRPINPVNNAVSDQDDDYLQRGDSGDRKVASDLLRGSSSGNFFNSRNRGKEDDDDTHNKQPEQELIKNKKKTKVRKLLTGKRPLNSVTPTVAANTQPPAAYNNQNKYSTLQRNYPTSTTAQQVPNRSYNNNFGNFNRQNAQPSSTTGFNNEYNKFKTSTKFNNPYTTKPTPSTDYYAETTAYNYNNNYNNNNNNNNNNNKASSNYNQPQTTTAPQYNYYSQQTTTPVATNYNAYQQSRVTTTTPNYSYSSQSTSSYYDATTSRPNYYQQQPSTTTVNYDNYYKTSTDYYSTSTDAAPFQNYYDKTSHNVYQQTKNQYNYNVNAASAASASETQPNYDPYTSYQNSNADKYDEPSQGESLKTAPSSNIRPSDFNSFKSFQQKPSGFNTSLATSYNFNSVQPTTTTTQKPTSKYYGTQKQFQTTNYKPSKAASYYEQSTAAGQTKPRPFSKSPNTTPATKSLKPKDASYDYAYYDDGPASEYDAVEPVGQEFSRTTPAKSKRSSTK